MNLFDLVRNLNSGDLGSLKEELEKSRAQLGEMRATGSSGGNMVNVTLNGRFELIDIRLDPICVDNRDVPMLQDLIMAAYNDAVTRMQEEVRSNLGPVLSNLTGLFK